MTKDESKTLVYKRLSKDAEFDAESQREAVLKYVAAIASETYQEWHRRRTKRGIHAARERRRQAAATQAVQSSKEQVSSDE